MNESPLSRATLALLNHLDLRNDLTGTQLLGDLLEVLNEEKRSFLTILGNISGSFKDKSDRRTEVRSKNV